MTQPTVRVLLIDDDGNEEVLVRDMLGPAAKGGCALDWAGTYEQGLQRLLAGSYDVALIDYHLGPRDGLELLREAKAKGCATPMILLTGMGHHKVDVEAMEAGAADYLPKSKVEPESLERSIRYAVERRRLESMYLQSEKLSAMGQLAAGIAHELNNPLMLILGTVKTLLESERLSAPLEDGLQTIDRAGGRCAELVRELLAYSRREDAAPAAFELAEAVSAALSLVRTKAKIQSVEIRQDSAGGALKILGHKNQIEQVVINLCNNALDAMPQGGRLTVYVGRGRRKQREVGLVRVGDTGPGIAEEHLGRIFEPFFTTKPAGKGTGLGLSIVQKIVHQHGGEVEVSSGKNGTVFTFTLPLPDAPAPREASHETKDSRR